MKIENPAEAIRPSAIVTFKARDRALSPVKIHTFFNALDQTATMSTLRLAIKFRLLNLVRKSEFIETTWGEVKRGELQDGDIDAPEGAHEGGVPSQCVS